MANRGSLSRRESAAPFKPPRFAGVTLTADAAFVETRKSERANPFLARSKGRPLVVGHRGVPSLHQENTVAGFRRAIALGIDAIELDARLTRDGRVVVCHDEDLYRLTGEPLRVSKSRWDEIAKLQVRRRLPMGVDARGRGVVADYEQRESIPLLAEVLAEVGGRVAINIELKLDGPWWGTRLADAVVDEVVAAELEDHVVVTSFDLRKLRAAKRRCSGLAVGFCYDDGMLDPFRWLLSRSRAVGYLRRALANNIAGRFLDGSLVGVDHTLVDDDVVSAVRSHGLAIGTHTLFPIGSTTGKPISETASTINEVERLRSLELDWIESDDPVRLLELLG